MQPEDPIRPSSNQTPASSWQSGQFVYASGRLRRPGLLTQIATAILLLASTVLLVVFVLPIALVLLAIAALAVVYLIGRALVVSWWRGRTSPGAQRRNVRVRTPDSAGAGPTDQPPQ